MLDTLDLNLEISDKQFNKMVEGRMERLGELQRALRDANLPVIITFEGWHGSGKGVMINTLVQAMDPRGFKVHTAYRPNEEEQSKPFFWQFWNKLPAKGKISIFDRSWYGQIVNQIAKKEIDAAESVAAYSDINAFERLLRDDNYVIIKFFAHISQKEHKKRIKELKKILGKDDMRQTRDDWHEIDIYETLYKAYEEMFSKTDTAFSPWVAVEAHDINYARIKVLDYIIGVFEKKLSNLEFEQQYVPVQKENNPETSEKKDGLFFSSVLSKLDLSKSVSKKDYENLLPGYQEELRELQFTLFRKNIPTILLFEGWDAAGKGGAIRRVTENMDPRGYYVTPVAAPSMVDKNYHYLWRFWKEMPAKGTVAIFDRSWYGRVMVERVEGFAREDEWRRAYREINEMEEQLINSGNILLKFWLQVDKDEQLKRFEARQEDPYKKWKITDEDWRNREKWDAYETAVNEMLFRTSTVRAPWTIVESNDKKYGRLKTIRTIIAAMKERL